MTTAGYLVTLTELQTQNLASVHSAPQPGQRRLVASLMELHSLRSTAGGPRAQTGSSKLGGLRTPHPEQDLVSTQRT